MTALLALEQLLSLEQLLQSLPVFHVRTLSIDLKNS
jgi:hypothetical protein